MSQEFVKQQSKADQAICLYGSCCLLVLEYLFFKEQNLCTVLFSICSLFVVRYMLYRERDKRSL